MDKDKLIEAIRKRPDGRWAAVVDGITVRGTVGRSQAEAVGFVHLRFG